MYLVLIAWLYVTLMMAVAEATSSTGSVLGAVITFVLYGLLPMGIVGYILGTPARKRAIKAREKALEAGDAEQQAAHGAPVLNPPQASVTSAAPDTGRHAPTAPEAHLVAPVRKEP